ncbi:Upstream stimulatory factor 1 [Coemansia spiralis]|nr:Upstream stimulatory factor 1 [Coemansia spiralis]
MFPQTHYPQAQAPARHLYLEPIQVPRPCGAAPCLPHPFPQHRLRHSHHQPFGAAAGAMLEPPSQSPTATCYSPGGSMTSDGTISDYAADGLGSPSPSMASPEAGSPPPCQAAGTGDSARRPRRRGARAQLTAEEKEKRRKVSHSAIEKRRRERTNSVLTKLQRMVPGLGSSTKVQKLEILQASAIYISELRRRLNIEDGDDASGTTTSATRGQMNVGFLLA